MARQVETTYGDALLELALEDVYKRQQKQITESILAQNKRDYRQDVKSGRI